jgi:hypothetical protein
MASRSSDGSPCSVIRISWFHSNLQCMQSRGPRKVPKLFRPAGRGSLSDYQACVHDDHLANRVRR